MATASSGAFGVALASARRDLERLDAEIEEKRAELARYLAAAERQRTTLVAAIEYLEPAAAREERPARSWDPADFFDLSTLRTSIDFATMALATAGRGLGTWQLIAAMMKLGFRSHARNPYTSVFGALRKADRRGSGLIRKRGKLWVLSIWDHDQDVDTEPEDAGTRAEA